MDVVFLFMYCLYVVALFLGVRGRRSDAERHRTGSLRDPRGEGIVEKAARGSQRRRFGALILLTD